MTKKAKICHFESKRITQTSLELLNGVKFYVKKDKNMRKMSKNDTFLFFFVKLIFHSPRSAFLVVVNFLTTTQNDKKNLNLLNDGYKYIP